MGNGISSTDSSDPVASPCISVCVLDCDDVCEGCFRTATEIASWAMLDDAEKRNVIRLSWERARNSGKVL